MPLFAGTGACSVRCTVGMVEPPLFYSCERCWWATDCLVWHTALLWRIVAQWHSLAHCLIRVRMPLLCCNTWHHGDVPEALGIPNMTLQIESEATLHRGTAGSFAFENNTVSTLSRCYRNAIHSRFRSINLVLVALVLMLYCALKHLSDDNRSWLYKSREALVLYRTGALKKEQQR